MFDSSNFCFLRAIGGILFPYIKDTKFLKHYQSICYKVFVKLRQSLEYRFLLIFSSILARNGQIDRILNFVPFGSYRAIIAGKQHVLIPVIAIILAFIPIGLLLGCALGKVKWW